MGRLLGVIVLVAPSSLVACTKRLTHEQCNHLLGRAIGFAAYPAGTEPKNEMGLYGGVPGLDVEQLRKEAKGDAKTAMEEFDKACVGSDEEPAYLCARHANDAAQLYACGGMVSKAKDAAGRAKNALMRKYNANQCSEYAQHALKVGAITADDTNKTVQDCDTWMQIGVHDCRMAAKDATAWKSCQ